MNRDLLPVEQVDVALAAFNDGIVRVDDSANPRGYVDYFRPREAMAKALRIAAEQSRTPDLASRVSHIAMILEGWDMQPRPDKTCGHSYEDIARDIVARTIPSTPVSVGESVGKAFEAVWLQARENHANHSATGDMENDLRFFALGLTGEAGELANFVKKRWRDGDGHDQAIRYEIADVCAYAFMAADCMGMTPADLIATIAEKQRAFIEKMQARRLTNKDAADVG